MLSLEYVSKRFLNKCEYLPTTNMFLCLQASFVATGNRTDISLEDPDFWQKWAKKAELDLDAINGRVLHTSTYTHGHTHTQTNRRTT